MIQIHPCWKAEECFFLNSALKQRLNVRLAHQTISSMRYHDFSFEYLSTDDLKRGKNSPLKNNKGVISLGASPFVRHPYLPIDMWSEEKDREIERKQQFWNTLGIKKVILVE